MKKLKFKELKKILRFKILDKFLLFIILFMSSLSFWATQWTLINVYNLFNLKVLKK